MGVTIELDEPPRTSEACISRAFCHRAVIRFYEMFEGGNPKLRSDARQKHFYSTKHSQQQRLQHFALTSLFYDSSIARHKLGEQGPGGPDKKRSDKKGGRPKLDDKYCKTQRAVGLGYTGINAESDEARDTIKPERP